MIKNNTEISPKIFSASSKKPQLFQGLREDTLQNILENSTLQNFKKDQILIQQGDMPDYAYFIVSGQMRSFRSNPNGNETTIRMLEAGDICMEAVIFMGSPSPITVQTLSDTRLILIPNKFMQSLAMQDTQFTNNLLKIVTHHYKNAMHQIDAMANKTPVQRVGYYFLQQHIEQGSNNMDFELPFKKAIIANHLGMTPETFSRALKQIKKTGIKVDGETINLKDAYALCHFCNADTAHECTLSNKEDCSICPMHKATATR